MVDDRAPCRRPGGGAGTCSFRVRALALVGVLCVQVPAILLFDFTALFDPYPGVAALVVLYVTSTWLVTVIAGPDTVLAAAHHNPINLVLDALADRLGGWVSNVFVAGGDPYRQIFLVMSHLGALSTVLMLVVVFFAIAVFFLRTDSGGDGFLGREGVLIAALAAGVALLALTLSQRANGSA